MLNKKNTCAIQNAQRIASIFDLFRYIIPLVSAHRGGPVKGFPENGANILSSDRHIEAGIQLMKFADDKKLKSKHIKLEKGNKLKRRFKIESPFLYN